MCAYRFSASSFVAHLRNRLRCRISSAPRSPFSLPLPRFPSSLFVVSVSAASLSLLSFQTSVSAPNASPIAIETSRNVSTTDTSDALHKRISSGSVPSLQSLDSSSLSSLSSFFDLPEAALRSREKGVPLVFTAASETPIVHSQLESTMRSIQDNICQQIINIEEWALIDDSNSTNSASSPPSNDSPAPSLREDVTIRSDGTGGGIARVFQGGRIFQKGAVNTSFAKHRIPFGSLRSMSEDHSEIRELFEANEKKFDEKTDTVERFTASISLILHPNSPMVPTVHANYRYFEFTFPDGSKRFWFGGGSDLTPTMVNHEDGKWFHTKLKEACDRVDKTYYGKFKEQCDGYFRNQYRKEGRGIGGIFFDDLNSTKMAARHFDFIRDCGRNFAATYFPIVLKHCCDAYTKDDVRFQQLRRGRYVEFNLVYDKGTRFGLQQPNARPEAILVSLPLTARFEYKYEPPKGSKEEETINILRNPIKWV